METSNKYQNAKEIFQAGLRAVAPGPAIRSFCQLDGDIFTVDDQKYDLTRFEKIFVLGAGKAGASMAVAIEKMFVDRITEGLITVK